jgi:uncharacterized protein YdaU (DUF1376 family)
LKTSPAFQFYPADFLSGTVFMSPEEVGAYIRLICLQWQQGAIPADVGALARVTGLAAKKLPAVLAKFEKGEDGLLRNMRLEQVRSELVEFRDLAKKGGAASGKQRTGNSEWGKQMAAKRQRTSSLGINEASNEPESERVTNTQSHTQSHTHFSECVSAGARPLSSSSLNLEEQIARIRYAWPRCENELETSALIRAELQNGTDPDAMLAKTEALAAVVMAAPDGPNNRYCPGDLKFFRERQWLQDPLLWKNRLNTAKAPARPATPRKELLTTKPAGSGKNTW